MRFYVLSNVAYPERNRIQPEPEDFLVFLNSARSAEFYRDFPRKCVYHRSPREQYGKPVPGMKNYYLWDGEQSKTLNRAYIDRINAGYDWNYDVPAETVKSATTGFYVVEFLAERYPNAEIVLVNFGYAVKRSTFRCGFHNWRFEAERLKKYKHIYTED